MSDFEDLTQAIVGFRDRRDWQQFHSLKNLAAGLSIEAAELQEIFLWKSDAEVRTLERSRSIRGRLSDEIADILIFSLLFCHEAGVDPATAIRKKLRANARKYPVRLAKGRATKYTDLGRAGSQGNK